MNRSEGEVQAIEGGGAEARYRAEKIAHWNDVARDQVMRQRRWSDYYHRRLESVYRFLVPEGQRVLDLGCGDGDLLASLKPAAGIGVDFSPDWVGLARRRHPHLSFLCADVHELALEEHFDVIILSDLVHDVWDLQRILTRIRPLCTPRTRVILNFYSRVWELPLDAVKAMGLARPVTRQNWFAPADVANLLELSGFEVLRGWSEILMPLRLPGLERLLNRWLVKLWPFRHLALTDFLIARPRLQERPQAPSVSVIVPARNEAGHMPAIFERMPALGRHTELIFVEGGSQDDTYAVIQAQIDAHPGWDAKLLRQPGRGKGDAVRAGFAQAGGDIVLILDADLTVAPEDLPRFVEALASGAGEFINGVRLVYPMEDSAMRPLNFMGNKFFSMAFSWLLGQTVKDTLCGTKALWRTDYERIAANRAHFGEFDPYGDFDLLFGAARLNLKIVDMPIRYRARVYGETNINRWSGGWLLLRMVVFAARRIKFV